MHAYDPLDWIHQWDDFEMMMYARTPEEGDPGIFMQVSHKVVRDGAQEWDILYDRKISDLYLQTTKEIGSDAWQEEVLRHHLNAHPALVNEEKAYVEQVLAGQTGDE